MSERRLVVVGWLLVGLSVACLALLGWAARQIHQWDALPLAALLHGALGAAAVAHGLTWRRGGAQLQATAQVLVFATVLYWLYTWFEPLQQLASWARVIWYGWLRG